ncbi:MAG: hypothetical protein ACFFBH_15145 [Promethearchaeota archaeon]
MKRQKSNESNNDEELPANILDNVSLDEIILYKSKGIKKPTNIKFKVSKYFIPIFSIIFMIEMFILTLFIQDHIHLFLPILVIFPIIAIVCWVCLFISHIFVFINYFALTNKALYIYQYPKKFPNRPETLKKIELKSLITVSLSELTKKKNLTPRGLLNFVYPKESSSKSMSYPVNRKIIGGINDVLVKCNIIESIIWMCRDVNERINIISKELNLRNLEISPTSQEFIRLKKWVKHLNIGLVTGTIVFLTCIILISLGNNLISTISSYGMVVSLTCLVIIIPFNIITRQVVPSNEGTMQITTEGLKFVDEKGTRVIDFNSNIAFNFKIIPNKMFSERATFIGTIIVQDLNNPHLKIKFGPTVEIVKILEFLFLSYLSWKNYHQLLLKKEEVLTLQDQKSLMKITESIKSKTNSISITGAVTSQTVGLSEQQKENIKKMLLPNEKVLTVYQPERKKQVLLIHLIGIAIGITLTFFSIWRFFEPLLMPIFVMVFTVGMIVIIFTLISLYNYIFIERIYIFTDQKLILKNFKKYYDVSYKDISLVLLKEGHTSDVIQIVFNFDSEIKTNAKISNINLTIEKDSDLYDKIIYYKKNFT